MPNSVDVRKLPYMPLFIDRLLNSDTWIMATGDEAKAMITLWCAAWHQEQAGTLPDNDKVLAVLSRTGDDWPALRDTALTGFEANDVTGRLHHAVIEEIAAEAFGKTDRFRKAAKVRWDKKQSHDATHMQRTSDAHATDDATHMQRREEKRIEDTTPLPPIDDAAAPEDGAEIEVADKNPGEHLKSSINEAGELTVASPADQLRRQRAAEAVPPNLLLDRERIIGTVMAFHISRANAEMLVNGARDYLSRQELVDLIQNAKMAGLDRDKLEEVIVNSVAKKERESAKNLHNSAVGIEAMRSWGKVSQSIRGRIGEATWKTFIDPIRLESINGEGITIKVSPAVAKELRSTNLAESIAKLWAEESGQATTVQILEQ